MPEVRLPRHLRSRYHRPKERDDDDSLLEVDERIQSRVLEEAQRLNIEPQKLFNEMLESLVGNDQSKNNYIVVNQRGSASVAGHRITVAQIAIESEGSGLSPAAIARSYSLSLAQIHAALSYYYDHQGEIDAQIEASKLEADRLQNEAGEAPFLKRMRAEGYTLSTLTQR